MNKVNKALKTAFSITVERPNIKMWRGHKVPFILYVRKHYHGGSNIWFNLVGPNITEWCKNNRERVY